VASVVDIELVIFDCDGVLVDSEVISNRVLAAMLTEQGVPTTLPQARSEYQGLLLADVLARAEAKRGRVFPADWLARYEAERAEAFRRELAPVSGAAETVEELRGAGLKVCVASQGKLAKTGLSLALTGLDRLFPERARFSARRSQRQAGARPAPARGGGDGSRVRRLRRSRGHALRRPGRSLGRDARYWLHGRQRRASTQQGRRRGAALAQRSAGLASGTIADLAGRGEASRRSRNSIARRRTASGLKRIARSRGRVRVESARRAKREDSRSNMCALEHRAAA
jgi:hypothetical protein